MKNSEHGRFNIWDLPSDPYDPEQLEQNFARLDNLIGAPAGAGSGQAGGHDTHTPPQPLGTPSTWLSLGDVNNDPFGRTLYSVISGLDYNDLPLGVVVFWWRPGPSTPLPSGCVPCDGSTYVNNTFVSPPIKLHSYSQASITVPDLRHAFIMGAYETDKATYTTPTGPVALNRDGHAPNADSDLPTDAPGIGYASSSNGVAKTLGRGSNVGRNLKHYHDAGSYAMPNHKHRFAHVHDMGNHVHLFNHIHYVGNHTHQVSAHSHGLGSHFHNVDHWHYMGSHVHTTGMEPGRQHSSFVSLYASRNAAAAASGFGGGEYFWPFQDLGTTPPQNRGDAFDTGAGPRSHSAGETNPSWANSSPPFPNLTDPNTPVATSGPNNPGPRTAITTGLPETADASGAVSVFTAAPSVSDTGNARKIGDSTDSTDFQDTSQILGQSGSVPSIPGGDSTAINLAAVNTQPNYVALLPIVKILRVDNIV
jgi:hypothetical protein